ncbi:MAG: hypothetical protein M1827_006577 [Pycnora praestabilis]|nr:MAG: hypothetical protein M1827_006577 [Pycnora praestabilis]
MPRPQLKGRRRSRFDSPKPEKRGRTGDPKGVESENENTKSGEEATYGMDEETEVLLEALHPDDRRTAEHLLQRIRDGKSVRKYYDEDDIPSNVRVNQRGLIEVFAPIRIRNDANHAPRKSASAWQLLRLLPNPRFKTRNAARQGQTSCEASKSRFLSRSSSSELSSVAGSNIRDFMVEETASPGAKRKAVSSLFVSDSDGEPLAVKKQAVPSNAARRRGSRTIPDEVALWKEVAKTPWATRRLPTPSNAAKEQPSPSNAAGKPGSQVHVEDEENVSRSIREFSQAARGPTTSLFLPEGTPSPPSTSDTVDVGISSPFHPAAKFIPLNSGAYDTSSAPIAQQVFEDYSESRQNIEVDDETTLVGKEAERTLKDLPTDQRSTNLLLSQAEEDNKTLHRDGSRRYGKPSHARPKSGAPAQIEQMPRRKREKGQWIRTDSGKTSIPGLSSHIEASNEEAMSNEKDRGHPRKKIRSSKQILKDFKAQKAQEKKGLFPANRPPPKLFAHPTDMRNRASELTRQERMKFDRTFDSDKMHPLDRHQRVVNKTTWAGRAVPRPMKSLEDRLKAQERNLASEPRSRLTKSNLDDLFGGGDDEILPSTEEGPRAADMARRGGSGERSDVRNGEADKARLPPVTLTMTTATTKPKVKWWESKDMDEFQKIADADPFADF